MRPTPRLDGTADLALVNGAVGASDTAIAVVGGAIALVGSDDDVGAAIGRDTTVVDLGGSRVVPGIMDGHVHSVRGGLNYSSHVDWSETTSLGDALASIRDRAAATAPGTWIAVVGGWHPGRFDEGRGPTVEELTAAAPHHPVYVQLLYEAAWVNEAGMAAAGIEAGVDDPPRGAFERHPDGSPTGRMTGPGTFGHCIGRMEKPSFDEQVESSHRFFRHLASYGLTGTIDPGGMHMTPESYRPLYRLWREGRLGMRMRLYMMPPAPGTEVETVRDFVKYLHPGMGDDMLRLVGIGEIPSFGCWDAEGVRPFEVSAEAKGVLREVTRMLAENGWPLHDHAILDPTISHVLDVWEEANEIAPLRDLRWSLAHAEPMGDANLDRAAALGIGIGVQARMMFRAADSAALWGDEVLLRAPPIGGIVDRGIPLGAGTDGTAVTPVNPWLTMWWLVTGKHLDGAPPRAPEHRMSRRAALDAYTNGSAWFSFDEDWMGRLGPGMAADLAVLDRDYFTVPEDEIPEIRSRLTIVDGKAVHATDDIDMELS